MFIVVLVVVIGFRSMRVERFVFFKGFVLELVGGISDIIRVWFFGRIGVLRVVVIRIRLFVLLLIVGIVISVFGIFFGFFIESVIWV